jgi:hypothetical protein
LEHRASTLRLLAPVLALAAWSAALAGSPYAKNQIAFPDDPFADPSTNDESGWVKFLVLLDDPQTVIFQNSLAYPFHYDFAVHELAPFAGMTPEEFDQVTLYGQGQLAVLGAVILPPLVGFEHVWAEYGIQLVGQDAYDPASAIGILDAVKDAVTSGGPLETFYFPTPEQQAAAAENQALYEAAGFPLSSADRWAEGNACYSHGWALGELKYFDGDQIETAFLNGFLEPDDILLTDAVPAAIPSVAGVISLAPSSPASHVVILAETFGVPFAHAAVPADAQRAQELVGRKVVLRAEQDFFAPCKLRLIDVEDQLDAATIDEILALKVPPPLDIVPLQPYGAYSASVEGLTPASIAYFGGKASNYALLRHAIPDQSRVATAFSFDLWNAFLDQIVSGGLTLRQIVAQVLAGHTYPPEDMQELSAALQDVRDVIKDEGLTPFPPAAKAAVLATLQDPQYGFDPLSNLRFRSSTNVEDAEHFTGAGLYESWSGCLEDDLDGDAAGPSLCDPAEPQERGAFRALRRVFASFYNLNAFLERLKHGVNEAEVGMAVLVHHSFPDTIELANGVGLYEPVQNFGFDTYLVSQTGASPVTNPEPGVVPEEVEVSTFDTAEVLQHSNLLPLGATVLEFPEDYLALRGMFLLVADAWEAATGSTGDYRLEFEYKKIAPGGELVVKQVRQVPLPDDVPSVTPFLVNEPLDLCVFQGEAFDAFGNHRLKSFWTVETKNLWLTAENLEQSFYADVTLEYQETCQTYEQTGPPDQWPEAVHEFAGATAKDGWRFARLQNPRTHRLEVGPIPALVAPSQSPVLTFRDFGCPLLEVTYDAPVPTIDFAGPTTTTVEFVRLCDCSEPNVGDLLQQRVIDGPGMQVVTTFWWPPVPDGVLAGYTAPLVRWVDTVIHGLTASPIVLQGDYSQTYRPEHHNFFENFLFEPALEPGIPQAQLDELAAAGVRAIHVFDDTFDVYDPEFTIYDDEAWGGACLGCAGFDADKDGFCTGEPAQDCDDSRADVWATPGEVPGLAFVSHEHLAWVEPPEPGGLSPAYDTLRSPAAADFVSEAFCVESGDAADLTATDAFDPVPGAVSYYLVRAENDCPDGQGTLGQSSSGAERAGQACP